MIIRTAFFAFFLLTSFFCKAALAGPELSLPLSCTLGDDCWIVNYVDTEPGPEAKDYRCGPRTRDAHQGTDFALADNATMEKGVPVTVSADGTVLRVRNGIEDHEATRAEIEKMLAENKGCGNGVLIDHGDGWQTIYCHLKKDSITVKPDQKIKTGEKIALVGQSGAAEMPHLHFGVFQDSNVIDPFTGRREDEGCGQNEDSLWAPDPAPAYEPFAVYATGFKDGAPDFESVKIDTQSADTYAADSPALVFWALFWGVMENDRITIEIRDPLERIFTKQDIVQEKTRARQFYYVGKKTDDMPLSPGSWTGYIKIARDKPGGGTTVREFRTPLTIR